MLFGLFCGCTGFCHRTESDLFLFLFSYYDVHVPVGFVAPSFEAVYCFIRGRHRLAVARYRIIWLVVEHIYIYLLKTWYSKCIIHCVVCSEPISYSCEFKSYKYDPAIIEMTMLRWFLDWCRGSCHSTDSDFSLFLFESLCRQKYSIFLRLYFSEEGLMVLHTLRLRQHGKCLSKCLSLQILIFMYFILHLNIVYHTSEDCAAYEWLCFSGTAPLHFMYTYIFTECL